MDLVINSSNGGYISSICNTHMFFPIRNNIKIEMLRLKFNKGKEIFLSYKKNLEVTPSSESIKLSNFRNEGIESFLIEGTKISLELFEKVKKQMDEFGYYFEDEFFIPNKKEQPVGFLFKKNDERCICIIAPRIEE
ncbi:MAG: hypothetical protein PHS54_01325 [Clostridia bacterium]|nr:hypothetical protein [Clostridia bacterium]